MSLTDPIADALKRLNFNTVPDALSAAFQMACLSFVNAGLAATLDEEALTGALVGAIAANLPWCNAVFGSSSAKGWWGRYLKSGIGDNAEPVRGADFSVVVRLGGGRSRIALFQAKKRKRSQALKTGYIRIDHLSPPRGKHRHDRLQFLNLWDWAQELEERVPLPDRPQPALGWVHYVTYSTQALKCIPFSALAPLKPLYDAYQRRRDQLLDADDTEAVKALKAPSDGRLHPASSSSYSPMVVMWAEAAMFPRAGSRLQTRQRPQCSLC